MFLFMDKYMHAMEHKARCVRTIRNDCIEERVDNIAACFLFHSSK